MRAWGRGDYPLWWEVVARNKKSVSADLRVAEGQDLARRLIAKADILIENFRPGTLEKWNLSPESLMREHPGLIIVRVSGYGQTGPYSGRAGFGGIGEASGSSAPGLSPLVYTAGASVSRRHSSPRSPHASRGMALTFA
jgi:formyl-CoA transferase